jgi:hypothetical protein
MIDELEPAELSPQLAKHLAEITCQLQILKYLVTAGEPLELTEDLAAEIATGVPDLVTSWSEFPTATEVDYADFWLRQVWNVSPDGKSKSSVSTSSFRYALYCPPYGSATSRQIEELDGTLLELIFGTKTPENDYTIFEVDTSSSAWFINDWWDYLWVATHKTLPQVVVIYGSATD